MTFSAGGGRRPISVRLDPRTFVIARRLLRRHHGDATRDGQATRDAEDGETADSAGRRSTAALTWSSRGGLPRGLRGSPSTRSAACPRARPRARRDDRRARNHVAEHPVRVEARLVSKVGVAVGPEDASPGQVELHDAAERDQADHQPVRCQARLPTSAIRPESSEEPGRQSRPERITPRAATRESRRGRSRRPRSR